jgi:hypothetical protein
LKFEFVICFACLREAASVKAGISIFACLPQAGISDL